MAAPKSPVQLALYVRECGPSTLAAHQRVAHQALIKDLPASPCSLGLPHHCAALVVVSHAHSTHKTHVMRSPYHPRARHTWHTWRGGCHSRRTRDAAGAARALRARPSCAWGHFHLADPGRACAAVAVLCVAGRPGRTPCAASPYHRSSCRKMTACLAYGSWLHNENCREGAQPTEPSA